MATKLMNAGPALSLTHARIESSVTLAPVTSLAKPQRPKSKSLQPCRCPKEGCGKMFSKRSNLKAHMRVHSGVLPYPCEFPGCTKRFRWKSSLKPHIKVHLASGHVLNNNSSICSSASTTVHNDNNRRTVKNPPQATAPMTAASTIPAVGEVPPQPATPGGKSAFRGSVLNLPSQKELAEMGSSGGSSPTTVMDSSGFNGRREAEEDEARREKSRQYICFQPGCQQGFPRMLELLEHEKAAMHQMNRPAVARALFPAGSDGETDEMDLRCESVLSGGSSAGSAETDVLSFTLDSGDDGDGAGLEMTEDLWKHELDVVDPFMELPVVGLAGGAGDKVIDMLSSDCTSGISASKVEEVGLEEGGEWGLEGGGSASSSQVDFSLDFYVE